MRAPFKKSQKNLVKETFWRILSHCGSILELDAKDVKFVVTRKFLLLGDEATIQRRGQTYVEWTVRGPVLAVVMGLFTPGIDAMPNGLPPVPDAAPIECKKSGSRGHHPTRLEHVVPRVKEDLASQVADGVGSHKRKGWG